MNRQTRTFALFLAVIFGGVHLANAQSSAPSVLGERIFGFVDKNSDKSIDSKEFGGFSASMQSWLVKHGFDGTKPISLEAFRKIAATMMSDLRRSRLSVGTVSTNRTSARSPKTTEPDSKIELKVEGPVEIEQTVPPGTAALPAEFQPGDLDGDGQIDFYEWRQFKRTEMARFYQLDANQDSVLSLAELGAAPAAATATPGTGTTSSGTSTGSSGTVTTPGLTATPATAAPTGPSKERLDYIKWAIGVMDKNKNKLIDPEEWKGSRRIGPAFTRAKIDLTKPMNEAQFIANYQLAFPEKSSLRKMRTNGGAPRTGFFPGGTNGRGTFGGAGKTRRRRR